VSVYLPAGRWLDVFTGQVVDGGRTFVRQTGLDDFPLYLRAGTTIGFNARDPQVWPDGWGPDTLSRPTLGGWLYAPQPGSAARALGSGPGQLDASTGAAGIRLRLSQAPVEAQVLVLARRAPERVLVGGRVLPRAESTAALRGMPEGWTFTGGPFGGIVLKLRPDHGSADVTVSATS
jgi:alpha-D-xyloside xylohydrolase